MCPVKMLSNLVMLLMQGRCQRDKCRYFHPPPHIGDHVLRGAPPGRPSRSGPGGRVCLFLLAMLQLCTSGFIGSFSKLLM